MYRENPHVYWINLKHKYLTNQGTDEIFTALFISYHYVDFELQVHVHVHKTSLDRHMEDFGVVILIS